VSEEDSDEEILGTESGVNISDFRYESTATFRLTFPKEAKGQVKEHLIAHAWLRR
jgi:hypothetical protein